MLIQATGAAEQRNATSVPADAVATWGRVIAAEIADSAGAEQKQ